MNSRRSCPECGHVFQGKGWEGIDAHWKAKHESLMPYEKAWCLIKNGQYKSAPLGAEETIYMAKGNDGNYLQHCVEIEAAVHLAQTGPEGLLHIALTHGMAPFEKLAKPMRNAHRLLDGALSEASCVSVGCNERRIVTAYRNAAASSEHYPNTAELLRAVIGSERLSGGITEFDCRKYRDLVEAWTVSKVNISQESWRKQLGPLGVLSCPENLNVPWLFSMDPMTYVETGCTDDDKLHRSDIDLLACALQRYVGSGQPGFASLFVYNMGAEKANSPRKFWAFMDELAKQCGIGTCSYWVVHRDGYRNLAGLLYTDVELTFAFAPSRVKLGRGVHD